MIIFALTISYSFIIAVAPTYSQLILYYRAFNRLFHSPFTAAFESLLLLFYLLSPSSTSPLLVLFLIHLGLHRLFLFCKKCLYVLISVTTAFKNTKQRFASQATCFFLQFTLLLPFFLLVLLFTTLLNTATMPYMGFAYFIAGYPKPQRQWSRIA